MTTNIEDQPPTLEDALHAQANIKAVEKIVAEAKGQVKAFAYNQLRTLEQQLGAASANFRGAGKVTMTSPTEKIVVHDHDQMLAWAADNDGEAATRDMVDAGALQRRLDQKTIPIEVLDWLVEEHIINTVVQLTDKGEERLLRLPRKANHPVDADGEVLDGIEVTLASVPDVRFTPDKGLVASAIEALRPELLPALGGTVEIEEVSRG